MKNSSINSIFKPVFFIGMGRSGSSIIYEAFAQHPELAFFSQYCTRFVKYPQLTFLHRFFKNYRIKEQWQKTNTINKIIPNPKEAYNIWEYLCGYKFRSDFMKDIKATLDEKKNTISYINKLIHWQGKKRFVSKITGPPRIEYLSSILKDAIFIDVLRDPRATIYSTLCVNFRKKRGFNKPYWTNTLDMEDLKIWERYNKSEISLLALEWKAVYKQTLKEKKCINSNQYLQVKYENFIDNPIRSITSMYDNLDLELHKNVIQFLSKSNYKNTNYKYLENLTENEVVTINEICKEEIDQLGYKTKAC